MAEAGWRDWDETVFEEARRTDRPILLFLKASWCRYCRQLEQAVFEDPAVVEKIQRQYVPLRIDKDRRPDINQRYNLGGWPTVAFLTPDGDLITGGSDLTEAEVRSLVDKAAPYYRDNREKIEIDLKLVFAEQEQVDRERARRRGQLSPEIVEHVARSVLDEFDRRHGGFGSGQKFPHPEALDFAILYYAKTGDASFQSLVQKTLSSMVEGRLCDTISGAFFRFCGTRDWRQPHTEILLETQAGLLRNYLEAFQLFDRAEFRRVATRILSYLEHSLRDPATGAYFASQDADDEYYCLDDMSRRERNPPRIERTLYTHSNAMVVSSLFKAASVLGDDLLRQRATQALHFLLETLYSPGRGMYHYYDGTRHILGLLTDQIYMARALIHGIQYTGDNDYLPILEDLITTIVKKQSATHGGFYDISEDDQRFGFLRRRNTSLLDNAVMAEVLIRAHCLTARPEYRELSERTLKAFAADYQLYGYFMAGYARAVELFFQQPVQVYVVGLREDPRRREMLESALRTYVSSKVVLSIDPEREAELLHRHGFPSQPEPRTYVCLKQACVAELREPGEVAAALLDADRRRSSR